MSKPNVVVRIFRAIWTGVDGVRKVLHLLLLLFIFSVVLAAMSGSVPKLPGQAALVIRPMGTLVEQLEGNPYDRAISEMLGEARPQTLVQDILDGLEYAKNDPRIKGVIIYLDGLGGGGLSQLQRIGEALVAFRESGKPVIAVADSYGQAAYYIASHADQVYMHPEGLLLFRGYGVYLNYFAEAIEKLKIDWNVFRVGTYKSAVEPFTRSSMSDDDRVAMGRLMNELWDAYKAGVQEVRNLEPGTFDNVVNNIVELAREADGSIAELAIEFGFVDELLTHSQVKDRVAEFAGWNTQDLGNFNAAPLRDYLAQMRTVRGQPPGEQNVAVIVAAGEILDGAQPPGTVGGDSTADLLRRARMDETVQAVVLRVNSPGGSAFASEIIRNEIILLKEAGKPVVASMAAVAASGGYWISMAADRIYASPTTITGSIGIFGMFPTIPRTLEKIGVRTDGVGTTPFAGAFDPTRPLQPEVGAVIQSVIDKGYRDFTGKVAAARGRSVEEIDLVARGRVWSGAQAKERGLVDEFGGLRAALADAAARAELGDADSWGVSYIEKPLTPFENFVAGMAESRAGAAILARTGMADRLLVQALPGVAGDLRFIEQAMARGGHPVKAIAHCFCMP